MKPSLLQSKHAKYPSNKRPKSKTASPVLALDMSTLPSPAMTLAVPSNSPTINYQDNNEHSNDQYLENYLDHHQNNCSIGRTLSPPGIATADHADTHILPKDFEKYYYRKKSNGVSKSSHHGSALTHNEKLYIKSLLVPTITITDHSMLTRALSDHDISRTSLSYIFSSPINMHREEAIPRSASHPNLITQNIMGAMSAQEEQLQNSVVAALANINVNGG